MQVVQLLLDSCLCFFAFFATHAPIDSCSFIIESLHFLVQGGDGFVGGSTADDSRSIGCGVDLNVNVAVLEGHLGIHIRICGLPHHIAEHSGVLCASEGEAAVLDDCGLQCVCSGAEEYGVTVLCTVDRTCDLVASILAGSYA